MNEVLSLLIDSITNSDRAFLWCLLDAVVVMMLPFFLEGAVSDSRHSVADAVIPLLVLSAMVLPPIYFTYHSSADRQKAAKLCDQVPDCNFEQMYSKAKAHVRLN